MSRSMLQTGAGHFNETRQASTEALHNIHMQAYARAEGGIRPHLERGTFAMAVDERKRDAEARRCASCRSSTPARSLGGAVRAHRVRGHRTSWFYRLNKKLTEKDLKQPL